MNPDENNANQAVPPTAPVTPETPPTPPEMPSAPTEAPVAPAPEPAPAAPVIPELTSSEPAPAVPGAPEVPVEPEAPNLDQVAADLANADPADVAPDTTSAMSEAAPEATPEATLETASTPATPEVAPIPGTPIAPEAPVAPDISVAPVTPGMPADVPATSPVMPAESAPETPTTPDMSIAPESPATPEAPATPQEDSYSTTSANFVDDTQNPEDAKPAETNPEDEEPLVPAEPVPGSIGSALAYSDTAPNHAVPVGKPSKFKLSFGKKSATAPAAPAEPAGADGVKPGRKPLTKENLKILIAIIGGVTLVAVIAVMIFFILNSGNNGGGTPTPAPANDDDTPTNTVSSLTCTRSGDTTVFTSYANVVSGDEEVIAMYANDELTDFGTTLKLTFTDEDSAKNAQYAERDKYSSSIKSAGLTEDPFTSSYDTKGTTVTVTHQAEGADIDSQSAKVLGLYVIKGEPQTDIETLLDTYETDGYTCIEK